MKKEPDMSWRNVDPLLAKIDKAACHINRYEFNQEQLENLEDAEVYLKKEDSTDIDVHMSFYAPCYVSKNKKLDIVLENLPVQTFMDFAKPFLKDKADKALSELKDLLK